MADRDPADFPGNPNPPAKAPDQVKAPPAPKTPASSAGSGALPPESQPASDASTPLAKGAGSSYSVSDGGIYAFSDNDAQKVGAVTLAPEDAEKILKGSGAVYDEKRGTYDNVPEEVVKTLASGKPTFGAELKLRYGAGEAELHRASLYDAALLGKMSFADARDRANPDLVQAQLAHYPGAAWKGLGDAVNRFMQHPLDEAGDLLRQSVMKTAEALPSIKQVLEGGALGAAVAAPAGLAGGPLSEVTVPAAATFGARAGTFAALLHMEVGGLAADMHEKGFDEATIRKVAPAAGALKAGLWMYGVEAMAMPFKGAFIKGLAGNEAAQKVMGSWATQYAINAGIKMPAVGALQSGIADLSNNMAAMVDKRPDLMRTSQDFVKNATQAAVDMAQVSAVAGIPGAAFEAGTGARDAKLAAEVDAKLEGVERREPASPSPSEPRANPSGEKTSGPSAQTASEGPLSETPRAPAGTPLPKPAELSSPYPDSITEHPGFVKAVEQAKADLPEGVDPHDRAAVIDAYKQAAQDAHDYKNKAMVQLGRDSLGQAALTPDEKNQISAQIDHLVMRMANLRDLALFARDPAAKGAYEDWVAGGQEGERPPVPIDPHDEHILAASATSSAEQKLDEILANKDAKPSDVVKAASPAERLGEKVQETTVKGRAAEVKTNLDALQQRLGEVASTRDRMQRAGLTTRAIDRQINSLADQAVAAQKEYELLQRREPAELEVSKRAKLEVKPATLQDITNIAFKEGGKQSQVRARELLAIAEENGLTSNDVKKLIGNKAIGAMGDAAYKNFLEGFDRESENAMEPPKRTPGFREGVEKLVERKAARAEVASVLQEKQLEKEQYIRQLNGLPAFSKMTTEQLKSYAEILRDYDKGDVALAPKRIEALKGTVLEGIKTEGEAREKAAQLTGQPVEDFKNVRVPLKARAIPDPQLRAWFPALRPFVDLAGEMGEKGDRLAETVRDRNETLAADAIRERRATMGAGAKIADWFAPQQGEVMAYLEAKEPADVAATAEKLTPAEFKWAGFLKAWFGTAEDYLVKKEGMTSRFSGSYAPHVNRGWPEIMRDLKEQGLWSSLKEFLPQAQGKNADFVDAQGNVLGFNKFFKQSIFRTGALEPSKNVVEAANHYISDFYRKAALDQIAPVLDTLARAMKAPPEETGLLPKENEAMTSSLQDFVKAWVNNKKGINNSAGAVGELLAPALRMSQQLAALHYIAGNYALQAIKGSVAIPVSEYMALGTDLFKAKALKYTDQGKAILEKYESFTGKSPWEEVKRPGADARDFASALTYGGFGFAHKAAMEDLLLGSMTKDEFAAGAISDARLNEIRQHAGRWMDLSRSDSIMGSSAPGKTFTQYKGWAIPPTLTLAEDARALARQVTGKGKMNEVQVREAMRVASLAAMAATVGTVVTKDMEDDSYKGQAIHYLRRAVGSVWRGLDPAFFFSAAGPGYVAKLANDLHLLGTLERDKNDELKGVKALKKDLTPRLVKDVQKAASED